MQTCGSEGQGTWAGGTPGVHLALTSSLCLSLPPASPCSWQGVGEPVSLGLAGCWVPGWGGSWVTAGGVMCWSHRGCPRAGGWLSVPLARCEMAHPGGVRGPRWQPLCRLCVLHGARAACSPSALLCCQQLPANLGSGTCSDALAASARSHTACPRQPQCAVLCHCPWAPCVAL